MAAAVSDEAGRVGDVGPLPEGLVLRAIRPKEIDQTAWLLEERGEPADGEDLRLVLDDRDAGLAGTAVVVGPATKGGASPAR